MALRSWSQAQPHLIHGLNLDGCLIKETRLHLRQLGMKRVIGNATLYLGDCRDNLPTLDKVDAVVTRQKNRHPSRRRFKLLASLSTYLEEALMAASRR